MPENNTAIELNTAAPAVPATEVQAPESRDGGGQDKARVSTLDNKLTHARSSLKRFGNQGQVVFAMALVGLFAGIFILGNMFWSERYYTPEEGLGYYLGLVGGVVMLLALAYSAVKRIKSLRAINMMRHWLRLHIVFGIVGPFLVLFHSTFQIGSLNGGIALVSMIAVFLSGIIGRFLYSRIYLSLDGTRAQSGELKELLRFYGRRIHSNRMEKFQEKMMVEPKNIFHAAWKFVYFNIRSRWLRGALLRDTRRRMFAVGRKKGLKKKQINQKYMMFRKGFREYMQAMRKVALLGVYERIFAFWRHAHVPLLYLLVLSGVVHVIAVHMY